MTVIVPKLAKPPAITKKGMLHLAGTFPTRPLQVKFELLYQRVGADWRLFGIHVDTPAAPAAKPKAKRKTN